MNIVIGKLLGDVAGRLHLYELCSKVGIEAFFYRMCYRNELSATDSFYRRNKDRVIKNASLFDEEQSKNIYLQAITFRRTHRLKDRPAFCKEQEYFNSLVELLPDEILIDCGAYVGDTIQEFISQSKNKYLRIIAFEPDGANYKQLQESCKDIRDCCCFNAGVWKESGEIRFQEGKLAGSKITERGGVTIATVSIDDCAECQEATFIKMDIEGAELMALQGARRTIVRNRPILTICLYHTDEDMLAIPEWMRENLVGYNFFCRHHSYYKEDTIIYAIPSERYNNSKELMHDER